MLINRPAIVASLLSTPMVAGCALEAPSDRNLFGGLSDMRAGKCEKGIERLKVAANQGPDW